MEAKELIDRLINDLKIAVLAKNNVRTQAQLQAEMTIEVRNPEYDANYSIEESWISLSCEITLPSDLAVFTNFSNAFGQIINYDVSVHGNINIVEYLEILKKNNIVISEALQKIKDNTNLIFVSGNNSEPIFNVINERLNYIHAEIKSVENCYKSLIEKP